MVVRPPGTCVKDHVVPLLLARKMLPEEFSAQTASGWAALPPPTAIWLREILFANTNFLPLKICGLPLLASAQTLAPPEATCTIGALRLTFTFLKDCAGASCPL